MSRRPWPDDRQPSAEELLDWCHNGMAADVLPYLARLLEAPSVLRRVVDLRQRWKDEVTYGVWNRRKEYEHRITQLTQALDGTLPPVTVLTPVEGDQA